MTKTIEEVKAAKQDLERKISQMVNEFAEEYSCRISVDVDELTMAMIGSKKECTYQCEIELRL